MPDAYLEEVRRYLKPLIEKVGESARKLGVEFSVEIGRSSSKYYVEVKATKDRVVSRHIYGTSTKAELKPEAIKLIVTMLIHVLAKQYNREYSVGTTISGNHFFYCFRIGDHSLGIGFNAEDESIEVIVFHFSEMLPPKKVTIEELADAVEGVATLMFYLSEEEVEEFPF
jgi:hypothetical protein